jgi:hypothetical protein
MLEMSSRSESLPRSDHLCLFKSLPRKAEMLAATDSTLLIQIAALRKNVDRCDVDVTFESGLNYAKDC